MFLVFFVKRSALLQVDGKFQFTFSPGLIKKNTSASVSNESAETTIKTTLSDLAMSQPNIGGPKATPKNLKLLYNEVIMPRSCLVTEPVIIVLRHGSNRPVPMLLNVSKPIKIIILLSCRKMVAAKEALIKPNPIFISQRMRIPFFLIVAPVI